MAIQYLQRSPRFQGSCCDNNKAPEPSFHPDNVAEQINTTAQDAYQKALAKTGDKNYAKAQQAQAMNGLLIKLNKQAAPNATPEELQAVLNAQQKAQKAGIQAFQKALAETGDKEYASQQLAKTVFHVTPKELASTPEGRSYLEKSAALHKQANPMSDCCNAKAQRVNTFA
jgi:hypothetical protein